MPFTTLPTFVAGRFSVDDANTYIRENLEALKAPPTDSYITAGRSSDYSTTSSSFTDVDDTDMALTITTTGDGAGNAADVMIGFCGTLYSSSSIRIYLRLVEDGVALNADDGLCVSEASGVRPVAFMFLRANASIGEHTYKLQYKVSSGTGVILANAGTSTRDCRSQFWVREMS
jgi:hypothetical protein